MVEDLRNALDIGGLEGRVGAGAAVKAALTVFLKVEVEVAWGGLAGEWMGEWKEMGVEEDDARRESNALTEISCFQRDIPRRAPGLVCGNPLGPSRAQR